MAMSLFTFLHLASPRIIAGRLRRARLVACLHWLSAGPPCPKMEHTSFPKFIDGDIKLSVQPDVYRLHSQVLAAASKVLGSLVAPYHEIGPLPYIQGMNHLGIREINLVGDAAHRYGVFQIQEPHHFNNEVVGFADLSSFPVWPEKTRQCWENMFKMFYKINPTLHDGGTPSNLLKNSLELVELAEDIEATHVVYPAIGTALEVYGQELYHCIANDPINWNKLGMRIQSTLIFQESAIHLVGRWNSLTDDGFKSLPECTRELCSRKQDEVLMLKQAVEQHILNHQPGAISHANPADSKCRDVYMWMAIAFFRQWLCQTIADSQNHRALDGGATFYRAIGAGGRAYLEVIDQSSLVLLFPIDHDEVKIIEERLIKLKEQVKYLVAELLANRSRYDPKAWGELPYLTCCKLYNQDFPWKVDTLENADYYQTEDDALSLPPVPPCQPDTGGTIPTLRDLVVSSSPSQFLTDTSFTSTFDSTNSFLSSDTTWDMDPDIVPILPSRPVFTPFDVITDALYQNHLHELGQTNAYESTLFPLPVDLETTNYPLQQQGSTLNLT